MRSTIVRAMLTSRTSLDYSNYKINGDLYIHINVEKIYVFLQNMYYHRVQVALIRQDRVIGFDDQEATITRYLEEPIEKLDIITIVGIPGQGKTTLAWKVYQSEVICYHFPIRIWISISQVFDSRDVFFQILKKFVPSRDFSSDRDDELAQIVRMCLERERFLLVLDDVWSVEVWNEIKEVLPMNNGMGKVIITSREKGVGMHSSSHRPPHQLKFLDPDESWTLLRYEVFGNCNLEDFPRELEGIGASIALKCDGVPLTLVVIGGILLDLLIRSPSPKDDWEEVLKFETDALLSDRTQRITDVVDLSYNRLPDRLRECFLYLGVFPQDYEIPTKTLSMLWICEGFIRPEPERSLEESAEETLRDLISRNLLKVEKLNDMGIPKTCRVPKMIRAFCILKSKDESLFQEVKRSRTTGAVEPPISEVQKSHRLCLHSGLSTFLSEQPILPHVRSFLCFYERPVELEPKYTLAIPEAFPKLRILESMSIKFDQFPAKLAKLIHLRYLTLYIGTLVVLPAPITQLWNLQALVVETRSRSITMKANLWRMVRLRHLNTNAAIVLDGNLEGEAGHNLQTLNRLAPESCTQALCKKATNLRTLGISGKLDKIFEAGFLEKLHRLEKLKLVNRETYEERFEVGGMMHRYLLPKHNCFPPNLKSLTLTNTCLGWEHMSTLAMIEGLEALKLKDNAFTGASWRVAARHCFPRLQLLLVADSDLVLWEASDDSFPNLRFLVVRNCEQLKEIPECLGRNLEKLEIHRVRSSVVKSARKIAETKEKAVGRFGVQFNLTVGLAYETK